MFCVCVIRRKKINENQCSYGETGGYEGVLSNFQEGKDERR